MENKEINAANTIKAAIRRGLFSTGAKFIRFERYQNINLIEQSQRNYAALLARLMQRTHIPEDERARYGNGLLSEDEAPFMEFWQVAIQPEFTGRHGTKNFAYIKKAGFMMPVSDRRQTQGHYSNNRTPGYSNQDYNYFVLGIGDDHPVPNSVAGNEIITLHFDPMTEAEKQQFSGMFIGGHLTDYSRDITYPIVKCGTTLLKVNYDKKTQRRTTTFERADGKIICEQLSFADEIIVANPSIDTIFKWLGYKLIEYCRFIGGDFQRQLLASRDIQVIAGVFHALFPSYRFPELKIPLKKIPLAAHYVEVTVPPLHEQKLTERLQEACFKFDVDTIRNLLLTADPNAKSPSGHTAVEALLSNNDKNLLAKEGMIEKRKRALQLLLDSGADVNFFEGSESPITQVIKNGQTDLLPILLAGAQISALPSVRMLPRISFNELQKIIELNDFDLFQLFYPYYRAYREGDELLLKACDSVEEVMPNFLTPKLQDLKVKKYHDSLKILQRLLEDCNPNALGNDETCLTRAARNGKIRALNALLAHKTISINQSINTDRRMISPHEGWTALHFACWKGRLEAVKLLVEAGADIHAACYFGYTPYALAQQALNGERDFLSKAERDHEGKQLKEMQSLLKANMSPAVLSSQQIADYQAICRLLLVVGASLTIPAEPLAKPSAINYAATACVTARCQGKTYVLLIRKRNGLDEPHRNYLFPGGFYDPSLDLDDPRNTALRETLEETGVLANDSPCKLLAEYCDTKEGMEIKRNFYHVDIGVCAKLPHCTPKSDVAEARWVDCELIKRSENNGELAMYYNNIAIRFENAYILAAILRGENPDPHVIIESQRWIYEVDLNALLAGLFMLCVIEPVEVHHQIRIFAEYDTIIGKMADTSLKSQCANTLSAIKMAASRYDARELAKELIAQAVRVGRFHVDELIFNKAPLIFSACSPNDSEQLFWLLKLGANSNSIKSHGIYLSIITPLTSLITMCKYTDAEKIIEQFSANPTIGYERDFALTIACAMPETPSSFIYYLIGKMGVLTDQHLGMVVHALIENKRFDIVAELLKQYSLNVNRPYPQCQLFAMSALLMVTAINARSLEAVKLLTQFGADLTIRIDGQSTLLDYALKIYDDAKFMLGQVGGYNDFVSKQGRNIEELKLIIEFIRAQQPTIAATSNLQMSY